MSRPGIVVSFTCLLFFCDVSVAWAQIARGSVVGTVQDAHGGVIAGVRITVTRVETNETVTAQTDALGNYVAPSLAVGTYRITAESTGFKTYVREGVLLHVEERARVDIKLEVGELSQKVEVTATAALTEPETSSLGQIVESKRILDLPLNGRNPIELMQLAPGVKLLSPAFIDIRSFNLTSVSINGGQGGTNAILVDGGSVGLPERNEYAVAPNVDAVQEFKVQTNSFSAEFGLTGGGIINMVSRSGGNRFAGNLFEFLRNDQLDANSWTNNANRLKKGALRYNQFGGSIGGPVLLPGYNGKNRTFFFFNYEGFRYRTEATSLARVATPLERQGDFSQTLIRDPVSRLFVPVRLFDPYTTRANPSGSGFIRDPLPTALPSSRLDPVAVKALTFIPLPNQTPDDPTGTNNFIGMPGSYTDNDQENVRIDHQFTPNTRLFARYTYNFSDNTGQVPVFGLANIADPLGCTNQRRGQSIVLGGTHIFGPKLLHEVRLSITRQALVSAPTGYAKNAPSQLGLPPIIPSYLFPRFTIGDVTTIGNDSSNLALRGATVGQLTSTLNAIAGRHNLKAGVDLRLHQRNKFQPGSVSGSFSFDTSLTGNPQATTGTGFGLTTFLLGAVNSGGLAVGIARADGFRYYAGFVQDDFKATRRLTLNVGLRYDLLMPATERFNRYSNLNPNVVNSITGLPGVLQFAGIDFGRSVTETDMNNWGPRVGFALDVSRNARTVIRGAYGIFYYHTANFAFPDTTGFSLSTQYTSSQGPLPVFQLKNGPAYIDQPPGSSLGPRTNLGSTVYYVEPNSRTPYIQEWNFGIQHTLPGSVVAEAAYAGSHGVKQVVASLDLKALAPQYLTLGLALDDRVPNPLFGKLPATSSLGGATISRSQSLQDFPAYTSVNLLSPNMGNSIYHSLQVRAEKRFSHGLSFLVAYTASKLIGDTGLNILNVTMPGNPQSDVGCGQSRKYDRRSCRSIEPQDVSQMFVVSYVYELPVGSGKRLLSGAGPLPKILGGWQVNGIATLHTGLPLVIRGANNRAADRPNQIRSAKLPEGQQTLNQWFDTLAFVAPPMFTYGSTPRTQPDVRGPGAASFDFSLFKNFRISERTALQFRSEFFNFFNRVNFNLPNGTFTSGGFGRITTAGDPRRVQLALKLMF